MFANFHLKDFMLLECYLLRKLVLEKFILLEDFGLMTFCYFGRFYVIGIFRFYEISLIFL